MVIKEKNLVIQRKFNFISCMMTLKTNITGPITREETNQQKRCKDIYREIITF